MCMLLSSLGYFLVLSFVRRTVPSDGTMTLLSSALFLAGLFVANTISELFKYGLNATMISIVQKKPTARGLLFAGLRDTSKRVFKAALIFSAIYFVLAIVCAVFIAVTHIQFSLNQENADTMLLVAGIFFAVHILTVIPFLFVYPILYLRSDMTVLHAFSVSAHFILGRVFHFIGFILYAGGMDAILAVVLQTILWILPSGERLPATVSMGATFLSFMSVLCQYRAITRFFLAIPLYFYALTGVLHAHQSEPAAPIEDRRSE